jgi:thioredoxin 1
MPAELAPATFRAAVLDAARPVLVCFHADGCGPCQMQAPMLDALASRFRGTATVYKVDAGRHPELGALFDVRSVPTMLLFAGGKIRRRFIGLTEGRELMTAMLAGLDHTSPLRGQPAARHKDKE